MPAVATAPDAQQSPLTRRREAQRELAQIEAEIEVVLATRERRLELIKSGFKLWLDAEQAAKYLRSLGFEHVTAHTIKNHANGTGKLPPPKRIGRGQRAHWRMEDLDRLVESL